MGHSRTVIVAALLAAVLVAAPAAGEADPPAVMYQAPVPGPIIEPFRPPTSPYGPGNRGVDYATVPGEDVVAPADGLVTFAGPVAGTLHVVVLHADGIRTSMSFLAGVRVTRGQRVGRGQPVGWAGSAMHFGARRGELYLDPTSLLSARGPGGAAASVLVPDGPGRPLGVEEEASGLRRLVAELSGRSTVASAVDLARAAGAAAAGSAAEVEALARAAVAAGAPPALAVLAAAAAALAAQGPCTPSGTAPPPRPAGRRTLVLVGGLGSSSGDAAVFDLDVAALGYAPADVLRFSYRGGTTAEVAYVTGDTTDGIAAPAARLSQLLARQAAAHPDRPLDVVAHSMGGLVARAALASPGVPAPATLVTLATPHGGADLAALARLSTMTATGRLLSVGLPAVGGPAPASRSVADLATGSVFLARLDATAPPGPPTRVAAVGSRTDLVVPPPRARWAGVPSTTVDLLDAGVRAHDALPGSPAATREVALAIASAPPTCRSPEDAVSDAAVGLAVQAGTVGLGAATIVGSAVAVPVGPLPVPAAGP